MIDNRELKMTDEHQNTIEENEASLLRLRSLGIIERHVDSVRSPATAERLAYVHSTKPRRIIMGDFPWYWVVSPVDAERLIHAGYELLTRE